jgi:hypothetical protein
MSATRGFRYPLACLLKKHEWDEQALRQELATAQMALAQLREEAAVLRRSVLDLNAELTDMRQTTGAIDLMRQQRLIAWRDSREELRVLKDRQVAQADRTRDEVLAQLGRTRQAVKGHENHRDRLAQDHRRVVDRAAAVRSDDEWLQRQHAREGRH